jgi:MFS family permease
VLLLLCAVSFISYIDRNDISVGAIAMQAHFGWSETQKGLVLSAFFVGHIAMVAASTALAHRFGGRLVVGLAFIWRSLCTIITPPAALTLVRSRSTTPAIGSMHRSRLLRNAHPTTSCCAALSTILCQARAHSAGAEVIAFRTNSRMSCVTDMSRIARTLR